MQSRFYFERMIAVGGRGAGFSKRSNSVIDQEAKEQTIETYYRRSGKYGTHYGDIVLQAVDRGDGNLEFRKAIGDFDDSRPNANTVDVTYTLKAGSVTHFNNGRTYTFGINWDNVRSVSGNTYDLRREMREKGFLWDQKKKSWYRK